MVSKFIALLNLLKNKQAPLVQPRVQSDIDKFIRKRRGDTLVIGFTQSFLLAELEIVSKIMILGLVM